MTINTINTINTANPYGADIEAILNGELLSPETMMAYIAGRMNDIDGDIKTLMGQQKDALAKKEALTELKNWMNEYKEANQNFDYEDGNATAEGVPYLANVPIPPADHPAHAELANLVESFNEKNTPSLNRDQRDKQIDLAIAEVEAAIDEVDGKSELNMLRLQQKVGERGTALQLVTQILQKMDQSLQTIAGNI